MGMVWVAAFIAIVIGLVQIVTNNIERKILVNFNTMHLYNNTKLRGEWQWQLAKHETLKNDRTYIEAFGGGKLEMDIQIQLMKEILKEVQRIEAQEAA